MSKKDLKFERRIRRKKHVKKHIKGTSEKPRLTVTRSINEIYAQIIDDIDGKTIITASSIDKEIRTQIKPETKKSEKSKLVGQFIAKRALSKDIKNVSFDRNGYLYHGRVKALADAAREAGLKF